MTALNQITPLSSDRLAEIGIRQVMVTKGYDVNEPLPVAEQVRFIAEERDRLIDLDVPALLTEVDRLNKVVEFLGSQLQGGAQANKHLGQVVVDLGEVMQRAARTAMELGAGAGMDAILGYLSDAGMLPAGLFPDPQDGEKPWLT